jgi:hypothetical protein
MLDEPRWDLRGRSDPGRSAGPWRDPDEVGEQLRWCPDRARARRLRGEHGEDPTLGCPYFVGEGYDEVAASRHAIAAQPCGNHPVWTIELDPLRTDDARRTTGLEVCCYRVSCITGS